MTKRKRKIEIAEAQEVAELGGAGDDTAAAKSSPDAPAPVEQVAEVDELAELRAKTADLSDQHLRAVAELQNFRRRAATESQETVRYACSELIKALLPAVDDLERSLAAAPDDDSSLAAGVKLVQQNLLKALEAHHVERIVSVGRPFDPELHEAMMQQPSDRHLPGTVLEEYQAGYKLWDRVLRHAKVIVSKGIEAVESDQGEAAPAEKTGD